MCWSPTADLVGGAAIAALGVVCLARLRRTRDLPLASLPALLGTHQLVEAAVWHSGGGPGPATLAWAVIALPLLALWVPLGVLIAAPPPARPRLLVPAAVGLATATALAYRLATGTVTAEVRAHSIGYLIDVPLAPLVVAGYLLATVGSLLLTPDPLLRLLGCVVAAGAVICAVLWRLEFVSAWCAFAAAASALLLGWVRRPTPPLPGGVGARNRQGPCP